MRSLVNQFLFPGVMAIAVGLLGVWTGSVFIVLIAGVLAAVPSAAFAQSALRRLAQLQLIASSRYAPGNTIASSMDNNDEIDEALQVVARYALTANARFAAEAERVRYLNLVLDRISDGLLIVDADAIVAYANVAAALMFGGRNPTTRSLIDVTHDHELAGHVAQVISGAGESSGTFELHNHERSISLTVLPLRDEPREVLVIARDVTEVNYLQQLRSDFVANVSHELRTPLSTIKILTETLIDLPEEDPNASRFLEQIDAEVDSMTALVRDLLNLTRLESVGGDLTLRAVDPASLLQEVVSRMRPLAERHGVTLHVVDIGDGEPIQADAQRMEQALVNLVANAIAHTPEGGTVTASMARLDDWARFSIRDTGRGIQREDLPRIWERFFKGDRSRSGPGTGLGLAIVKHIVQAHGGQVSVESVPGKGSAFHIEIPDRPGHEAGAVRLSGSSVSQ